MFPVHTSTSVVRFLQITCQKYYFWKNLHYLRFLTNNLVPSKSAKAKGSPEAFSCIYHKYPRNLYLVDLKMRFKTWKIKWKSRKFVSKLKYWKCSQFSLIATISFLCLSIGLKMKPLENVFSSVKTKTKPNFAVNLLKGAAIHFSCLFDESRFSNIRTDNGMYRA